MANEETKSGLSDEERSLVETFASRWKRGDRAQDMGVDIFALDLVKSVINGKGLKDDELIGRIKKTQGFGYLNTKVNIPDETLITLIGEIKTELSPKQ